MWRVSQLFTLYIAYMVLTEGTIYTHKCAVTPGLKSHPGNLYYKLKHYLFHGSLVKFQLEVQDTVNKITKKSENCFIYERKCYNMTDIMYKVTKTLHHAFWLKIDNIVSVVAVWPHQHL